MSDHNQTALYITTSIIQTAQLLPANIYAEVVAINWACALGKAAISAFEATRGNIHRVIARINHKLR